ncbi:MAG: glycine cleavage system protein GcvH [Gammaproteobacteria bacterium]|nr:glycine cleavage system protein GcvH [Gammaproteobacteria bacterium]MDE2346528.1 glycine cleavage system protein GcvH [Gammaproteobacteria bacterium]
MSKVLPDLSYTKTHEWVKSATDGSVTIGITDHAQEALGDIVFVEVPQQGRKLAAGEAFAVVESVKAASDIYSPVAGEVMESNSQLTDSPEKINADAYGSWIVRLKPANPAELKALLDAKAYEQVLKDEK